jgi:hypothetical protein
MLIVTKDSCSEGSLPIPTVMTPAISGELARLEAEEREVSLQRQTLHRRIDHVYLGAPLNGEGVALLDDLEGREQAVSAERRSLHTRIDRLRIELGLPPWRELREPRAVA